MTARTEYRLGFKLLCLVVAALILRPGEMVPGLAGLPIYEGLVFGSLACCFMRLVKFFRFEALKRQPVCLCFMGVFLAIPLSHVLHAYLGGIATGLVDFAKTGITFALVVTLVDRWERFEKLIKVISLSSVLMISLCVVDYAGVVDFPFITHVQENHGVDVTGADQRIARMNGTGIFSDPNDISLLIVATGVMCCWFLTDPEGGPTRKLWLLPLAILAVGLVFTKSRGGLLAAGGATGVWMLFRYGPKTAFALGCVGLLAVPLLAGRQAEINLDEGTGHDRVVLWKEGLIELQSPHLFFGTGHRTYHDIAGLVAHNSFVHAFVELGLFGGTLFFGMFFFAAWGLWRLRGVRTELLQPRLARFLPYMAAIGTGWTVGLQSLSRCYQVSTLLILSLLAAYLNLASWNLEPRRLLVRWDRFHVRRLVLASLVVFAMFNVFVRVVA